jgi:glycosyltransferase involved in cell wall biosynthesis
MPDTLVSVIVPTVGRASLDATLASLRAQKRAHLLELILVADTRVTWGHPQRNDAMARCRGLYIASLDDDDVWDPDALERLYRAALAAPDRPLMFRMRYGDGSELWRRRAVDQGNVGTPMFVVPNLPEKLGRWGHRYEGDLDFFTSTLSQWPADALVWRPEVLAHIRPGGTP